jgi:hypothetical protein
MKFKGLFTGLFLLSCAMLNSQEVVQAIGTGAPDELTPQRGWNLQAGYTYAVVNNRFEIKGQYKSGVNVGLVYRFGQWFALEGSFSRYQRHAAFSLDDIQSWTADLNAQLSMRIGESDLYFRTVFGGGYVDWKGYYIGPNLNDNNHYYIGKLLKDKFYTFNLGCGFSHYFFRQRMEGFGDFRMRVASDKRVMFTIADTQFLFGIRYSLVGKDRNRTDQRYVNGNGSSANGNKNSNASRKGNREKKRKVYKWMKDRK